MSAEIQWASDLVNCLCTTTETLKMSLKSFVQCFDRESTVTTVDVIFFFIVQPQSDRFCCFLKNFFSSTIDSSKYEAAAENVLMQLSSFPRHHHTPAYLNLIVSKFHWSFSILVQQHYCSAVWWLRQDCHFNLCLCAFGSEQDGLLPFLSFWQTILPFCR